MSKTCVIFAVLVLSGFTMKIPAPAEPPLAEQLHQLAPHAAGLAQVEVIDIKDVDERPGDGNLYAHVRFKVLGSSGAVHDSIDIVKAYGGLRPNRAPAPQPHGPVKPDTFRPGVRYWVAFASSYDWAKYPQGVVKVWPDKGAPQSLARAINVDYYKHRPQYHPETRLVHSYRTGAKDWLVRMERDDKLLWERKLPGEKYRGPKFDGEWRLYHRDHWNGFDHTDKNISGWFLMAETAVALEQGNAFQLPAQKHRLIYALDADKGRIAAVWVTRFDSNPMSTPSVIQYFDEKTGAVRREERYDLLEQGGLAAGANEERWLRKLVRTLDPTTRQLKTEEVLRFTTSPNGSTYVPVNKK